MGVRQVIVRISTRQSLRTFNVKSAAGATQNVAQPFYRGQIARKAATTPRVPLEELEMGKETEEVEATRGEAKDMTEYLVLQRRICKGVEEPWMVWGFGEETDYPRLLKMREEMEQLKHQRATMPT